MASPTEAEDIKTLKRLMGKHLKVAFIAGFKVGQAERGGKDAYEYWEEYWKKGEED